MNRKEAAGRLDELLATELSRPELLRQVHSKKDSTIEVSDTKFKSTLHSQMLELLGTIKKTEQSEKLAKSAAGKLALEIDGKKKEFRYQAVLGNRLDSFSVTLRATPQKKRPRKDAEEVANGHDDHWTEIEVLAQTIFESRPQALRTASLPSGLLLLCGRTGAAKSETAAWLIEHFLRQANPQKQTRHLIVAAEDPAEIETKLNGLKIDQAIGRGRLGPEWRTKTWRVLSRDLEFDGDLEAVLRDALRQSPSLVFVGELRQRTDFEAAVRFAKTGHFVMATMHAGSIKEGFQILFSNLHVASALDRGSLAHSLVGLVHLESVSLTLPRVATRSREVTFAAALPAVWWSTPISRKVLATSSIGALLPQFREAHAPPAPTEIYYPGYFQFATILAEHANPLPVKRPPGMGPARFATLQIVAKSAAARRVKTTAALLDCHD